jgi:putative flippase GtrA
LMADKLKRLLKTASGRYVAIGVCVYLLELLIILIAQRLGASAVAAVAISFWLGLAVSFSLQKIITFGDKRLQRKVLVPQVVAYGLLVLFNFGFTVLVTGLLSPPVPPVITRTLAIAITTIWNFYLYKTRIFKVPGGPVY